jgi:hypothetical protein
MKFHKVNELLYELKRHDRPVVQNGRYKNTHSLRLDEVEGIWHVAGTSNVDQGKMCSYQKTFTSDIRSV